MYFGPSGFKKRIFKFVSAAALIRGWHSDFQNQHPTAGLTSRSGAFPKRLFVADLMNTLFEHMRTYPTLLEACGVIGSIIYVGGFALVQYGRACGNGAVYSASKILAALLVLISLVGAFNLGAFLIQIGFVTFGIVGLCRQSAIRSEGERQPRPQAGYVPHAPAIQDSLPATSGWQNHPRGPAHDTPVPLCPVSVEQAR